ncbi:MAG: PilT/PilU family type 4a pilus ATPase [Candidatus Omnitrophica bacterium]|nr:PilT/PilU family type 4a pilus ATPase [Candidatus Omnitrophota bacterium]
MNKAARGSGNPRIKQYLDLAVKFRASDIHLVSGRPPVCRVQGALKAVDLPAMDPDYLLEIIGEMLTDKQREQYLETHEMDFSYSCIEGYYFRVNVHQERNNIAATIRVMPSSLSGLPQLGLSKEIGELTFKRSGLILIVGRAGSGKTTTMTHLIEHINQNRNLKIITVEDPIEFVHTSRKCLIIQREVGADTATFTTGLKYALRQDPDVVVVGEMRDLDSISMTLTTAETGHLVIATIHAPDAIEAINRIIDVYPGDKQNQIRVQMAENLLAVIGQHLLPKKDDSGRVLASELIVSTLAVRNMIRRSALSEIRSQMETGREGMYTLEQSLSSLVKRGVITPDVAQSHAKFPALLEF